MKSDRGHNGWIYHILCVKQLGKKYVYIYGDLVNTSLAFSKTE